MRKPRYFSVEIKRRAVKRIAAGEAVATVADEVGAGRSRVYRWYKRYQEEGLTGLRRHGRPVKADAASARGRSWQDAPDEGSAMRRHIADLERKIGQQQVDLDFFRKALRHVEETRRAQSSAGAAASIKSSRR